MSSRLIKTVSAFLIVVLIVFEFPYISTRVNAMSNTYETTWKEYNLGLENKGFYLEPAEAGKDPALIFVHGQDGVNGIPRTDRVHVQDYGWDKSYATNGAMLGTSGESKRLEGIQIVLVPKDEPAPGATYEGITAVTEKAFIEGF